MACCYNKSRNPSSISSVGPLELLWIGLCDEDDLNEPLCTNHEITCGSDVITGTKSICLI